jgi:hypothetical protein
MEGTAGDGDLEAILNDLEHMPIPAIQERITACCQRFSGELSPILDKEQLAPTVPYHIRCEEVLRWVLAMQKVQSEHEVFDQHLGSDITARGLCLVHALYRNYYHRCIGGSSFLRRRTESNETQEEYQKKTKFWQDIGHIHTVIVNVDKIARSMHILTRILWQKDDAVVGNRMMNPFRTFQETRWIQDYMKQNQISSRGESDEETDEMKKQSGPVKTVVKHCLDLAMENQYRRLGSFVYEERKVVFNGIIYGSRAYQLVTWRDCNPRTDKSDLNEFVTRATARDVNPHVWSLTLSPATFSAVIRYLERSVDLEFPKLHMQRRLFSFRNGIYDSQEGKMGAFYFYDQASCYLPPLAVAANFFEHDVHQQWFEVGHQLGGWFKIPTPLFQSILDYQNYGTVLDAEPAEEAETSHDAALLTAKVEILNFTTTMENAILNATWAKSPEDKADVLLSMEGHCQTLRDQLQRIMEPLRGDHRNTVASPQGVAAARGKLPPPGKALPPDVQRWVYIFLGRLLHDLNTFDSWQILPFLKGKAGTGKSAIGMVAQSFFQPAQVGIVSNNIEPKFGLGMIADRFIMLCLEVKKDFQMDQGEFQSIVSGELVQLAVKNKEAYQKKWTAPGLFCGNEWAKYQDAQGSIARRLALFNFSFRVKDKHSKPSLQSEIITQELGALLVKCNMAYREQADIKKGQDIWKILPDYFKHQREQLQIETDPLMATIHDPTIFELKAGGVVAWHDFKKEYALKWKQIRGNPYAEQLTEEKWGPVFGDLGLEFVYQKRVDPALGGSEARLDNWILGLRRIRDVQDDDAALGSAAASSFA